MTRRLVRLFAGLAGYGLGMALMVRADLGLNPWDVLHEGISKRTGLSFGLVALLTGVVVLLAWIPIRQRPGFGTLCNVVLIGPTADLALAWIEAPDHLATRTAYLLAGLVLIGLATAAYVGAAFGPGPRDGLMTGLSARTGWSIQTTRIGIEVSVLVLGWALDGTVGVGTVVFALCIGPLVQAMLSTFEAKVRLHHGGVRHSRGRASCSSLSQRTPPEAG